MSPTIRPSLRSTKRKRSPHDRQARRPARRRSRRRRQVRQQRLDTSQQRRRGRRRRLPLRDLVNVGCSFIKKQNHDSACSKTCRAVKAFCGFGVLRWGLIVSDMRRGNEGKMGVSSSFYSSATFFCYWGSFGLHAGSLTFRLNMLVGGHCTRSFLL